MLSNKPQSLDVQPQACFLSRTDITTRFRRRTKPFHMIGGARDPSMYRCQYSPPVKSYGFIASLSRRVIGVPAGDENSFYGLQ